MAGALWVKGLVRECANDDQGNNAPENHCAPLRLFFFVDVDLSSRFPLSHGFGLRLLECKRKEQPLRDQNQSQHEHRAAQEINTSSCKERPDIDPEIGDGFIAITSQQICIDRLSRELIDLRHHEKCGY